MWSSPRPISPISRVNWSVPRGLYVKDFFWIVNRIQRPPADSKLIQTNFSFLWNCPLFGSWSEKLPSPHFHWPAVDSGAALYQQQSLVIESTFLQELNCVSCTKSSIAPDRHLHDSLLGMSSFKRFHGDLSIHYTIHSELRVIRNWIVRSLKLFSRSLFQPSSFPLFQRLSIFSAQ